MVSDGVSFRGAGRLPSAFPVSEFAAASVGTAGAAVARLAWRLEDRRAVDRGRAAAPDQEQTMHAGRERATATGRELGRERATATSNAPEVVVDRGLASLWFSQSFKPVGWELPPAWDAIAGDYECADGWIRLHTNSPHHRLAALGVLGLASGSATRESVAAEVAGWAGEELEAAVVAAGGCAAQMRNADLWREHPQGNAVAAEPLIHWTRTNKAAQVGDIIPVQPGTNGSAGRPLAGVRVLDLTRVLAGPVATRFLAGYGADVLRIDPPDWSEPALEPEMTLGKNCARLDLKTADGLRQFKELLAGADILVHGYRPSALAGLGLGDEVLAARVSGSGQCCAGCLWLDRSLGRTARLRFPGADELRHRRRGHAAYGSPRPHPLPVQALDHATGYLLAAAAVLAWTRRLDGEVWAVRASLARTAVELLAAHDDGGLGSGGTETEEPGAPQGTEPGGASQQPPSAAAVTHIPEETAWGPGERLPMPVTVRGVPVSWDVPARGYGSAPARWT